MGVACSDVGPAGSRDLINTQNGRNEVGGRLKNIESRRHILVALCEGDTTNSRVWNHTLNHTEFEIAVHLGSTELNPNGDEVDLAVLDADVAEAKLAEWLKQLVTAKRRVKVMLLTSSFTGPNVLKLASRGDLVLPKPLDGRTFANAVHWLLQQDDPVRRFARAHKLSPRETALVRFAVTGTNNDEAAALLGCSRATISTYWNRVFRKTGVSGQKEVIILLFTQQSTLSRTVSVDTNYRLDLH